MDIIEINNYIKSLPNIYHWIVNCITLAMYSHLLIGFLKVQSRLRNRIKIYFKLSYAIMLSYFFLKYSSENAAMLDAFFLVYVIYYFSTLIIFQARFFNCLDKKGSFKDILKLER